MTLALLRSLWGFAKLIPWWVYVILVAVIYHMAAIHTAENRGRDEANARWEKQEAIEQAAYNAKVVELTNKARAQEQDWQTRFTEIGVEHAEDIKAFEDQRDADVAAARSGAIKLRVAGGCVSAGSGSTAEAPKPAARSDGPGACELPGEVTANLLGLADDANRVAKKLARCQQIVNADRSTKGTP